MYLFPLYLFVSYWIEFLAGETLCRSPSNLTPSTVPGMSREGRKGGREGRKGGREDSNIW